MRLEPFRLHYQDAQQRHKSFFIDNTNKCTSIKIYTFTYNPVRLQYVSIFFRSFSEILHQTIIHESKDELSNRLKFSVLKDCGTFMMSTNFKDKKC